VLDVFVVGFRKTARFDSVIDGKDGVALVNLRVIDDGHHGFEAALGDVEDAAHVVLHVVARDGVGRESRCGGGDSGMDCSGSFCGGITRGFHQSPLAAH
jgi:hypothetical protein